MHQARSVVGEVGDLGHSGQAEVAPLGQDRGIEMADQVLAPGLATAGVLEAAAEARPAVDLDQQLAQLHLGQPLVDELFEDHGALRPLLRFERGDDEVSILHPDTRIAVQQGIDPVQERLQLGLALRQTRPCPRRGPGAAGTPRRAGRPNGPWGSGTSPGRSSDGWIPARHRRPARPPRSSESTQSSK